jgi:AcrR family transcriptional regulator
MPRATKLAGRPAAPPAPAAAAPRAAATTPATTAPPGVAARILSTASDLFYKEGVRAVGIQRVIDEAGIAKASLYAHYDSKDDLVAACIDQRTAAGRAQVEANLADPALDARARLLRLFDLQVEAVADPGFRGCPLLNATAEIADPTHPARAVTAAHRSWLHRLFTSLAEAAGARQPADLAGALIVLYDGAPASALLDRDTAAPRHARRAAEQLIDAHLPPPRRPRR